jgi:dTDP-4-amino-4,6-dideoxygalactose transaminase
MIGAEQRSVPFLDLAPSHAPLKAQLLTEIGSLIDSGAFTNGTQVREFEEAFAAYCGTRECIGVASGLDALRLALIAAELGEGAEVIVPALTFVASFEAVAQAGLVPVPADIRDDDFGLDGEATRAAWTAATRAVMPVHLYGQLADLKTVGAIANEHGALVLEDACQAHGATRDDTRPGVSSLAAAFSFYPGKNLGAMGDAGALVTNDSELAARVRAVREHGQVAKYRHQYDGYTSRLDTIQALVLAHKLRFLDGWNAERRTVAEHYGVALHGIGDLRLPSSVSDSGHVWHLYVIRTADPVGLAEHLSARGISTGRHYPEPPHLSPAWRHLGYAPGDFPVAEAVARECLSLPMFPGLTEEQVDSVVSAVRSFFVG